MMATGSAHSAPSWFVAPGEFDALAFVALGLVLAILYGLVTLYALFDRWAEKQAHGTPLAKTIPTLLTIALLYEIFPLGHFNILLPIAAILLALMADWSRFHISSYGAAAGAAAPPDYSETAPEQARATDAQTDETAEAATPRSETKDA